MESSGLESQANGSASLIPFEYPRSKRRLLLVSGATQVFPIGREATKDGPNKWVLVLNPPVPFTPGDRQSSDNAERFLRVVVPLSVDIQAAPKAGGVPLGVLYQGDVVAALGQDSETGWWQIEPGAFAFPEQAGRERAWVPAETFEKVEIRLVGSTPRSAPPAATPTATPPPAATPTATPPPAATAPGALRLSRIGATQPTGMATPSRSGNAFRVVITSRPDALNRTTVQLFLASTSDRALTGEITLNYPAGTSVYAANSNDGVTSLTRTGQGVWKFTVQGPHSNEVWDLSFTIHHNGPYEISGSIRDLP